MLEKAYEPGGTEDRIYKMWEDGGAFKADPTSTKEAFSISMPPPNATGQLHLGHAVMLALEDIFTRFARMQGKETLWVPGTDHAAIATESLVIRNLQKGGMGDPRKQLGREKLLAEIAAFVEKSRDTIRGQVRKMGSSCDWSRERYTLEPALNRCVNEVFKRMYDDGLIYRGHRIVNWDPKLQTTVSDEEVDYKEEVAPFYTFQYGPFQIGTSRPETKFGDKYVVMHPEDERYLAYKHGDTFTAEWINGPIQATVIKDNSVDPTFGTGVMTITPWHDAVDFEIAQRHGLEREQVIDYHGKLLPIAGDLVGMSIAEARPLIVEKLKSKGLLVKVDEKYVHNKATNSRGGGAIEPQIKLQWFIDVNKEVVDWFDQSGKSQTMSLKQILHSVVHRGDVKIIPERFNKTYFHWIDNLRDWCISRQIWWGHRVPVYYCSACEMAMKKSEANQASRMMNYEYVSVQPLTKCPHCNADVTQDTDTLDTWFSSALWTWSTLIDPKLASDPLISFEQLFAQSPDFQKFHPTTVMETGYDILFFWVARMILMTTYTLSSVKIGSKSADRVPFKTVYLHGLIRARDGRKMSKSHPETMIDPLDMINKYGADALRLSMIVGQSAGNDARLYEEKIAGYRNFINKLWNASRFVLMQCEQKSVDPHTVPSFSGSYKDMTLADTALLSKLRHLINDVTKGLTDYSLSEVGERLYAFVWDFFCDWYLELSKGEANINLLVDALRTILALLHPYCPFVTEELWSHFKQSDASQLMHYKWPNTTGVTRDEQAEKDLQSIIDCVAAIRKIRTDQAIQPAKQVSVMIKTSHQDLIRSQQSHIERMAKCSVKIVSQTPTEDVASVFLEGVELHVNLAGLFDTEKEKQNLMAELENLSRYAKTLEAKLSNEAFVARAPSALVDSEKRKLAETSQRLQKIEEKLKFL